MPRPAARSKSTVIKDGNPPLRLLIEAPRWLLLAALVFAPWAYGSTRDWAIQALSILLACLVALWLAGCAVRRSWPRLPVLLLVAVGALLLQGWWMTLNAHSSFATESETFQASQSWKGAPGSVDGIESTRTMFLCTGLLGLFLFTFDLLQRPKWRKRVWITMALTGLSIAAFGVAQKLGGESVLALLWEPEKRDIRNNFAAFRYRGNAGAFLNILLPLVGGLAFLGFQRRDRPAAKAVWLAALCLLLAGIQLNPSRAGWAIAVGIGLVLAMKVGWEYWRGREHGAARPLMLAYCGVFAALLVAVFAFAAMDGWETGWRRAGRAGFSPANRSPTEIYRSMIPGAGATGFGPGTFRAIFTEYQRRYDFGGREVPMAWKQGLWYHAHQDYLQTIIEWGWLGTMGWAILVLGGVGVGVRQCFRIPSSQSRHWLVLCSVVALTGLLVHAWIDFPFQIPSIQLYVVVLLAACWSARSASTRTA